MAGIAHLSIGLAAKPLAPEVNSCWLILGNYLLDLMWFGFVAAGLELWPKRGTVDFSLMRFCERRFTGRMRSSVRSYAGPRKRCLAYGRQVAAVLQLFRQGDLRRCLLQTIGGNAALRLGIGVGIVM